MAKLRFGFFLYNFQIFINEWLELKKREYDAHKDNYPEINSLEEFLQKDDGLIVKKINQLISSLDMDKIIVEKEKEALKKEH